MMKEKVVNTENLCELSKNCRNKCSKNIDLSAGKNMLFGFYTLDINAKNALLFSGIQRKSPMQKAAISKRKVTNEYNVNLNGLEFASLHSVLCSKSV